MTEPNGKQVMKVTLNGPNALQGIRDLAGGGLLEEPPEQLRNLVLGIGVPSNDIKLVGTEQQPQPPKSLGGEEDETAPKK